MKLSEFKIGLIVLFAGGLLVVTTVLKSISNTQNINPKINISLSSDVAIPSSKSIVLTYEEVAKHNSESSCYLIIENDVYDVTKYIYLHPGGAQRIIGVCGTDASVPFSTKGGEGSHTPQAWQILTQLMLAPVGKTIDSTKIINAPDITGTSEGYEIEIEYEDD